ncbi:hypothetical protein FQN53_001769 [Emmonsiellopsis sp. PD_33]|nr:hypothetical protein FQN53_001769 [Emmonsiellopsis sp. PD_33]
MSGRRLLDAISFLHASRSVAGKHVARQRRLLDLHIRTSSLTKEAKAQLDRISLGLQAASELARKFEDAPQPTASRRDERAGQSGHVNNDEVAMGDKGSNNDMGRTHADQATDGVLSEENILREQSSTEKASIPSENAPRGATQESQSSLESQSTPEYTESPTISAPVQSTSSNAENEPSEAEMQQLFRSPKVASALSKGTGYRARPYGSKPSQFGRPSISNPSLQKDRHITATVEPIISPEIRETAATPDGENDSIDALAADIASNAAPSEVRSSSAQSTPKVPVYQMVESRVPSTRLGRLWEYGGLATSMAFGIVGESIRRATSSDANNGSLMFSPDNVERLVSKLSKMRGAALKLGQMMSFQDAKMLPPAIHQVLQRVQDKANYMPAKQRDQVLVDNLGPNWRDLFESFDELPMAAASIGQVHKAVLKETGQPVAVKIQYPGVADSIDSDLNNLSVLLTASRLLPKGLYLDKTIANARTELAWECDYIREAECGQRFKQLLADETSTFIVPTIIPSASGKQVLTMEHLDGIAVTKVQNFTQSQRDWIGTQILRLCLREICEFRFMQTDPNWTNFLYNAQTNKLELLDFGASRDFPASFISTYLRVLLAASRNDRTTCRDLSIKLGYLTGFESPAMVDAHISSILTLSEPFMASSPDVYDFSDQTITDRVRELIPLMLRERLAPPPEETYSLHRKLSGAFLLCARLGSRVRCKELFENALERVEWVEEGVVETGEMKVGGDGLRRTGASG